MNPFGVVDDNAIPGPRVILDDDEIGSDSPGRTSWVVIVVVAVAVVGTGIGIDGGLPDYG